MPHLTTTGSEIRDHLAALGVEPGENLCVHSRMLSFGRIEGGADFVRSCLLDAVGVGGTIAVPTFTFNVKPTDLYDAETTPPFLVGALSESIRNHPDARRTDCPVHSVAAIGPASKALMAADPSRPLGPGSAFEAMRKEGFKLILLGCTYQEGATHVHHVEADIGVPYRSWTTFPRQVRRAGGQIETLTVHYYAKNADAPKNNLHAIEAMVDAAAHGTFVALPRGNRRSHAIALDVLERDVRAVIAQDPYALVAKGRGMHD